MALHRTDCGATKRRTAAGDCRGRPLGVKVTGDVDDHRSDAPSGLPHRHVRYSLTGISNSSRNRPSAIRNGCSGKNET